MKRLFDVSGKTVLVTGGARGLGRMIAEGFVSAGCKVYITSRDAEALEKAAGELRATGECIPLSGDLTTPDAVRALANEVKTREARLHVIINNAGRTWGAPLEAFPDRAWPEIMAVNVQGPFTLIRELLPLLKAAGSQADPARVLNVGSLAGAAVERLSAYSYSASKAALHHLSRELAAELAPHHITVNAVVPGYFPTRMTAHIRGNEAEEHRLLSHIPLGRFGRAEDIAGVSIFLASSAGSYITGSEVFIDGGKYGCR